jgi:hypothetical protein
MAERVWSEKDLVRRAHRRLAVPRHAEEVSGFSVLCSVDPEARVVDLSASVRTLCLVSGEELAEVQVMRVYQHRLAENLGVEANLVTAVVVPVFGNPVVECLVWLEVRGEAAADASGDAAVAQQRATNTTVG